jgi:hypothetical protein
MQERRRRRSTKTAGPSLQADLFEPTSHRPTWESLPQDARRAVTELLSRMLREAREQSRVVATTGARPQLEAADE